MSRDADSLTSLVSLHSSDRLALASPQLAPFSAPSKLLHFYTSSPLPHPCSIASCLSSTTAPPLSLHFLPLAILCFASSTHHSPSFCDKAPVWLCQQHRARLEEYRSLAVGHAEANISAWDDVDMGGKGQHRQQQTQLLVRDQHDDLLPLSNNPHLQLSQLRTTRHLPAPPVSHSLTSPSSPPSACACSALTTASFSSPNYSTFPSAMSSHAPLLATHATADGAGSKACLSVPARLALAGGWLFTASFLSLWAGYAVLNLVSHLGR